MFFSKNGGKKSLQITKSLSCFFFFFHFLKNINSQKIKWRWAGRWCPEEGAGICGQVEFSHFAFCAFLRQRSAAVGSKAFAFVCARRERKRERARERSCTRSLWGWCVSVKGAGDGHSGDGSRRRRGASVVGLKSSSMGLLEAAAARGSRVILHFCRFVRDYGVFLRR